jgi:hypothetical protein
MNINWRKRYSILSSSVLTLLLVSLLLACSQLTPSPAQLAPLPIKSPPAAENKTQELLPSVIKTTNGGDWNNIQTFTGKGNQTTPPFPISSTKWRITWTIDTEYPEYAVFNFFVYPKGTDGTFTEKVSYSGDNTSNMIYIYEGGRDYYIKVIAANLRSWIKIGRAHV